MPLCYAGAIMMHKRDLSRRDILAAAAGIAAAAPASPAAEASSGLKVAIFSKHLQFLQGAALAKAAAGIGFDGVDLAVRRGGHVEPESVAADLPPLVAAIRQHGLDVPMITTDIVDTRTPHAEDVLRAMHELGIHHYRWGGFKYDYSKPLAEQLDALKPRVAKLAELNRQYGATAMYHTHSGVGLVGAPIWDLHIILREFDPAAVGINYDIGHATIEGGFGGWIDSFYISGQHLRGIAVKDCLWVKGTGGGWKSEFVPLGTGMVHFARFFGMVKDSGFAGPLQLHFEYPLGGAENGKTRITIPKEEVFSAMRRDLKQLRAYLQGARLTA